MYFTHLKLKLTDTYSSLLKLAYCPVMNQIQRVFMKKLFTLENSEIFIFGSLSCGRFETKAKTS